MAVTDMKAMCGLQWGVWLPLGPLMLPSYWILWLGESHVPSNMLHVHCLMFIQELFDPDVTPVADEDRRRERFHQNRSENRRQEEDTFLIH